MFRDPVTVLWRVLSEIEAVPFIPCRGCDEKNDRNKKKNEYVSGILPEYLLLHSNHCWTVYECCDH